jgi:hypothetical protein
MPNGPGVMAEFSQMTSAGRGPRGILEVMTSERYLETHTGTYGGVPATGKPVEIRDQAIVIFAAFMVRLGSLSVGF